jgi:hypothetical protein
MNLKSKEVFFLFLTEATLFYLTLTLGILSPSKLKKILEFQKIELPSLSSFEFIFYYFLVFRLWDLFQVFLFETLFL